MNTHRRHLWEGHEGRREVLIVFLTKPEATGGVGGVAVVGRHEGAVGTSGRRPRGVGAAEVGGVEGVAGAPHFRKHPVPVLDPFVRQEAAWGEDESN